MLHLELTAEQQLILINILENTLSDLRMEIVDTDTTTYKDFLKERKHQLVDLLALLRTVQPLPQ